MLRNESTGRQARDWAVRSAEPYGQVDEIILTLSTFSFGAFAAEAAGGCVAVLLGCSTVPEISTL
jgi:hypothetical protein